MEAGVEIREHETGAVGRKGGLREAAWLAGADVRKSWVSFPVAAGVAGLSGLYVTLLYLEALAGAPAGFATFTLDIWFLLWMAVLNVNFFFNRDYYYRFSGDNYTRRLSFLRGLPIEPRTVVAGRAMYMAVALACGTPGFFLVPYLTSAQLRAAIGPQEYAWFVGIWLGYALFAMGFLLFMWNGLSWRAERALLPWLFPGWCFLISAASALMLDDGLTLALIRAARAHGPLAAGVSLAIGGAVLVLWVRSAERRLARRELG